MPGDNIQSVNGAGIGAIVTSVDGQVGAVDTSGGGAVSSVDGQTGVVVLSSTYLALAGGTLVGALTGTTMTGTVLTGTTAVRAGATPWASSGQVRLPSLGQINWRNAADSGDIGGFSSNASDQVQIGSDLVGSSDSFRNLGSSTVRWANVLSIIGTFGGNNPASAGALRLPNATSVVWRNAANSGNVTALTVNASDQLSIGADLVPSSDSFRNLGGAALRWANILGVIVTAGGNNPAASGQIRLPNGSQINFRNNANSSDIVGLAVDSSDRVIVGADFAPASDNTRALGTGALRWASITAAGEIIGKDLAPASTTGATVAARYFRGTASGAPTTGTWVAGDIVPGVDGTFWHCTVGGTPGTWVQTGSGTYVPLAPTATTFTGDHTAALTDIGKVIEITNGDLTIPTNATVAFPVGQTLEVLDCGATSAVNVVNASGVQVQSRGGKFTSAGQYASFVLRQRSTDVWHVAGDLVAFAPDTLSGLVFWFKGGSTYWQDSGRTTPAVADGDPVAAWDDSSVGANHATTATAGYRPTLKTGANGINGVSVLRWDGTDDNLVSAASASTKPFTLFAVCKPTSFAAGRAIVGAPSAGGMSTVITTGGKQEALKSGTAVIGDSTTALTAAAACIIELTYSSSGGFAFYKAGVADGSGTGNQTFTSMSTVLGKDPGGGGSTFLGDIAEIIKYDAVLTANQLQAVENYLGNKYGIAVS